MPSEESAEILENYLNGEDTAAKAIFDRYTTRLIGLAKKNMSQKMQSRVDAEDIVQAVYQSFFLKTDKDNQKIELKRNGSLWNLLAAMTVKKVLKRVDYEFAQKRTPNREESNAFILDLLENEPTPDDSVMLIEQLTVFMAQLKERDRNIFQLRLQGESREVIATQLNIAETTVRRVLSSIFNTLQDLFHSS